MDYQSLQDLYVHELKDLHSAEKQILRSLPKMAKHAASPQLRELLEQHREETRMQAERVEQILERLGKSGRGVKCKGVEGIIEEAEDWIAEEAEDAVKDAGLIGELQRMEHYEIAGYGTARAFAAVLGFQQDVDLLAQTLEEEARADRKLTEIAEGINMQARQLESASQ
jgi:ferritin-like metal-binding protein YciE